MAVSEIRRHSDLCFSRPGNQDSNSARSHSRRQLLTQGPNHPKSYQEFKMNKTVANRAIQLYFTPSSSTMIMNPILWIIILGLRSGALAGLYQDVTQNALTTPTRTGKWAAGNRPVLHKFHGGSVPTSTMNRLQPPLCAGQQCFSQRKPALNNA